jgi:hypothetical protein
MFLLPAYDPTAMAMLGFGILAVLGLPFFNPNVGPNKVTKVAKAEGRSCSERSE